MSTARSICACVALLAVAALCGAGTWAVVRIEARLSSAIDEYAVVPGALSALVDLRSGEVIQATERQAAAVIRAAERQVARTADAAERQISQAQTGVLERVDGGIDRIDARAKEALAEVRGVRGDIRPVLASTDELIEQTSGTIAVLRPQLLGTLAATKVTMGQAAQAARRIDAALPAALVTWQEIGSNSALTTAATARAMDNLAAATKPLPRWLRYPLAITGAIAPTAAGALGAAAATGAFR